MGLVSNEIEMSASRTAEGTEVEVEGPSSRGLLTRAYLSRLRLRGGISQEECCRNWAIVAVVLSFPLLIFLCNWPATVDPLSVGLKMNGFTSRVDTTQVYMPGFYWIGIGRSFITFPTTQVTITFSDRPGVVADAPPIATRTGEDHGDVESGGQAITLSVSLQYTLPKHATKAYSIGKIYKDYGLQYHQRYTLVARNVISDVAQTFAPYDFWTKRTEVADAMLLALKEDLLAEGGVTVNQLQILEIDFPQQYEDMITQIQLQVQAHTTKEYSQRVIATLNNLDVMKQANEGKAAVISANADARSTMIRNEAKAKGQVMLQAAKANATKLVATELGLTNTQVVQFMKMKAISNHPGKGTTISTEDPTS